MIHFVFAKIHWLIDTWASGNVDSYSELKVLDITSACHILEDFDKTLKKTFIASLCGFSTSQNHFHGSLTYSWEKGTRH